MNVFDYALKIELEGKAFYEKLAKETSHAGLRSVFSQLASDEQKHYDVFLALKEEARPTVMIDTPVLEQAKNVFEEFIARKEDLAQVKGDLEAYRYGMKIEADSVRLYEEAAGKEKDRDIKALLLRIVGEEQKHFNILQNIHDFFNAPNQYLAWGEFSNLEEFYQFGRDVD